MIIAIIQPESSPLSNFRGALKNLAIENGSDFIEIYAIHRDAAHVKRFCGMHREAIDEYANLARLINSDSSAIEKRWMLSVTYESIAWCHIAITSFTEAQEWIEKGIDTLPAEDTFLREMRLLSLLRYKGQLLQLLGHIDQGLSLQRNTLSRIKFLVGQKSNIYLGALNDYIVAACKHEAGDDTLMLLLELESLASSLLADNDPKHWRIASNCSAIQLQKAIHEADSKRIEELSIKIEWIFKLQRTFHGDDHENTIQTLRSLASAKHELGKCSQAIRCLSLALRSLTECTHNRTSHRFACIMDISYILFRDS